LGGLVVHWKRSPYDVYVGRPGEWGNPFIEGKDGTRDEVIEMFEMWLMAQPDMVAKVKRILKDKILGCWCHPKKCHADILARVANE
jgi:hypothetical protein